MKNKLRYMGGEEFIRTIFSGERDLSRIFLYQLAYLKDIPCFLHPVGCNLEEHPYFSGFQAYLEEQEEDFKTNPIRLENSTLTRLIASGLHIPFTKGRGVNFTKANLSQANLTRAEFRDSRFSNTNLTHAFLREVDFTNASLSNALCINTDLSYAKFRNADLTNTNFEDATLIGADFRGANLDGTNFNSAKLAKVDIRGAKNLEQALNLNLDPRLEIRADKTELYILSKIQAVTDYTYF